MYGAFEDSQQPSAEMAAAIIEHYDAAAQDSRGPYRRAAALGQEPGLLSADDLEHVGAPLNGRVNMPPPRFLSRRRGQRPSKSR